jgi:hypothetical protein
MNMKAMEAQLKVSDDDFSMKEAIENKNDKLQNLSFWWQGAGLQDRIELQFSLWPEGSR